MNLRPRAYESLALPLSYAGIKGVAGESPPLCQLSYPAIIGDGVKVPCLPADRLVPRPPRYAKRCGRGNR